MVHRLLGILLVFAAFSFFETANATNRIPVSQYDGIETHIVDGPWTGHMKRPKNGTALYMFHWRGCPYCMAFLQEEKASLLAAGVDVRMFPFPATSENQDDLAYLAAQRDIVIFELYNRRQPINAPHASTSNRLIDAFNANLQSYAFARGLLTSQGQFAGTPLFIYQDKSGAWFAVAGYSEEIFAPVRSALIERANATVPREIQTAELPLPSVRGVSIPECPQIISWAYVSGKQDANVRGGDYVSGQRPGTYRLWGLREEQLIETFGGPLDVWTQADFLELKTTSLRCLSELYVAYGRAHDAHRRTNGRGDPSEWQRLADLHKWSKVFLTSTLHMDRPIQDQFYYPNLMAYQQALHENWKAEQERRNRDR